MELNKAALSDSSFSGASLASTPQLHASADCVDARKINSPCEDSGYHSSRNIANSDIYSSNAKYMQPRNQEVITMQSKDDKNLHSSLITAHEGHNLIPRSLDTVCSSSFCYMHPNPYRHVHDMNSSNLDGNANHIRSKSEVLYDSCCIPMCKGSGIRSLCTCSNFYPSVESTINTSNSEKQFHCQVSSTNCNCKRNDCHTPINSRSYGGNNLAHTNGDFKSETSDLAEKIEFCLLFGYTVNQIQHAIFKLGYKASKNDILAELSSMQNNIRASSVGDSAPESSPESSQGDSAEQRRELLTRGADPGVESEVHHSHILIDEEDKDEDRKDRDDDSKNLRPIVIDGSNVAMSHGNKQYFSCKGILIAVNYFRNRNHTDITVFVPQYRKEASRHDTPIKEREILTDLEKERILVFTPSRNINGKRVTCYDDRFILKLAQETNAVIVSNDNFRDLQNERPEWKTLVEKRLLMYSFVNDRFMPPDDPLGRNGPNIDNFLRIRPASEEQSKPQCPYGKKCTYGKKCKFFHPECPRPVSERIVGRKSDNNRKKSKFSLALAAELIQRSEKSRVSSTSASTSSHQDISMENISPSLHYQCSRSSVDARARKPMPTSKMELHAPGKVLDLPNSVMSAHLASLQDAAGAQRSYANPDNLSESFRQMAVSSHRMPQQSSCAGHANVHMCYDPHCQKNPFIGDKSQIPLHQCPRPEPGPPDYHADHLVSKHAFQRSSPANLQQGRVARSAGNPVVQQQWNVAGPYQTNPHIPAQFALPPYLYHQSRMVDPHYPPNQSQQVYQSYQMPPHSQGIPPVRSHFVGAPLYVASVNTSTGSNNSLSRSFPHIPSSNRMLDATVAQNYGSSSSHSDPHGYSFQSNLSSRHHHHHHGVPHELSSPNHSRVHLPPSSEPPLSSEKNPRFYLYRNLCGLFQRPVVEAVMKAHPDVKEPNKIIALIKQMLE